MLKGISRVVSPDLLYAMSQMGHGDELVFADAHFPGASVNHNVIRADGVSVVALLNGVLPLFELDDYVPDAVVMMAPVQGDEPDPRVASSYDEAIRKFAPEFSAITFIDRFDFYARAERAYIVVMTGETRKYANIILKKGVTPEGDTQ